MPQKLNLGKMTERTKGTSEEREFGGVLEAALEAKKAHVVNEVIRGVVSWVEGGSRKKNVVCLLEGINAELIEELAIHFPRACRMLLSLNPCSLGDIMVSDELASQDS